MPGNAKPPSDPGLPVAAFLTGTLIAAVLASLVVGVLRESVETGFWTGLFYLLVCGLFAVSAVLHLRGIRIETSREAFWAPFIPIFLAPVGIGAALAAYEWKADQPWIRYPVILVCFGSAVVFALLLVRLMERPKNG